MGLLNFLKNLFTNEPISYQCVRDNQQMLVINTGYLNQLGKDEWYLNYVKNGELIEETYEDSETALRRVGYLFDMGYDDNG